MKFFRKIKTALRLATEKDGYHQILSLLRSKYGLPVPQSAHSKWKGGIKSELSYWDNFVHLKGYEWRDTYHDRLDPDAPLQPRPAALLPESVEWVSILDVGAGPLSYLGKKCEGRNIVITAVDPLANDYNEMLARHGIEPPVKTQPVAAEELHKKFAANTFDLVFARNCIDHSYDPEKAILQMIQVAKLGCYVLLEHTPDEAERQNYDALHQWNFSMSEKGDFLIRSKHQALNFTEKYADICDTTCEIVDDGGHGEWLITRIRRKLESNSGVRGR
jgi:SAM-dependent methyltransferase